MKRIIPFGATALLTLALPFAALAADNPTQEAGPEASAVQQATMAQQQAAMAQQKAAMQRQMAAMQRQTAAMAREKLDMEQQQAVTRRQQASMERQKAAIESQQAIMSGDPPTAVRSAQKEAATAHAHAMMAANANTLEMTHTHLHHVVNCLVGPGGKGFDAAAADPCKGMGRGALNDAKGDAKLHDVLEQALATARRGLESDHVKTAQRDASKAAALLQKAQQAS